MVTILDLRCLLYRFGTIQQTGEYKPQPQLSAFKTAYNDIKTTVYAIHSFHPQWLHVTPFASQTPFDSFPEDLLILATTVALILERARWRLGSTIRSRWIGKKGMARRGSTRSWCTGFLLSSGKRETSGCGNVSNASRADRRIPQEAPLMTLAMIWIVVSTSMTGWSVVLISIATHDGSATLRSFKFSLLGAFLGLSLNHKALNWRLRRTV